MKQQHKLFLILTIAILATPVFAYSAAKVTIDTLTEIQVITEVSGNQQISFKKTESAAPGDILRFTLQFQNMGDSVAEDVVLNNPIPANSLYQEGSATTFKGVEPLFSIDDGTSFDNPTSLTYKIKNPDGSSKIVVAPPGKYTHIRWQLPRIKAGEAGQVSFNVLIQ